MKAVRTVQILLLILLALYLVALHSANPVAMILPLLVPLPPVVVVIAALVGGWLVGWLPGRLAAWRKDREIARLRRQVEELERHLPSYDQEYELAPPVIPDREPSAAVDTRPGTGSL